MLTIKEVAAYLPEGVKFISSMDIPFDEIGQNPIWTIYGINEMFGEFCLLTKENSDAYALNTCKLALRPLSDLVNEIEHNGERFVPIRILGEILNKARCQDLIWSNKEAEEWILFIIKNPNELPSFIVQKLLEWHFDIHKLIPQNLAIDLNTIK